jgi:flagellar basal-body rod protein FlgC
MNVHRAAAPIDIVVSGLRAQSTRMNIISNNIANANTTRTPGGQPFRRQDVVLSTSDGLSGVKVDEIVSDQSDFSRVYEPGNPQADKDGFVQMPNVQLPVEMMNMVQANRAYQANAAMLKRYMEAADITAELLK